MIRQAAPLAAAVAILAFGLGVARADDRKEIDVLYAKLTAALKNLKPNDTLPLEALGFMSTEQGGKKLDGKQLAAQMQQENEGVKKVKLVKISIKKLAISGKTAKAMTDFHYIIDTIDAKGEMGKKGATHELSVTGVVSNDLIKTAGGWKFLSMTNGAGTMMVDGKPMQMPGGGGPKTTKKM